MLSCSIPPFQGDNNCSVFEKIMSGKYSIPNHVEPLARVCLFIFFLDYNGKN